MTKSTIEFEDFEKVDLRVGTIIKVESFTEARNASYKIYADFGKLGMKQTSAQVTHNYDIDEMVGKQVVGVMNLKSKKIAGFKSEFLLLGVNDQKGHVSIISPDAFVDEGSSIY
ncbi:MAG: tRNA-binding protein [Rickettsiales bacterium]